VLSLYNAFVLIGPQGLIWKHRKLDADATTRTHPRLRARATTSTSRTTPMDTGIGGA